MFRNTKAALVGIGCVAFFCMTGSIVMAQGTASSPAAASTSKAEQKAQRKAARKEARAKKNAELGTLEKKGYLPGSNDIKYPENLQNAEGKKSGK